MGNIFHWDRIYEASGKWFSAAFSKKLWGKCYFFLLQMNWGKWRQDKYKNVFGYYSFVFPRSLHTSLGSCHNIQYDAPGTGGRGKGAAHGAISSLAFDGFVRRNLPASEMFFSVFQTRGCPKWLSWVFSSEQIVKTELKQCLREQDFPSSTRA
jgi:hypothetical protein